MNSETLRLLEFRQVVEIVQRFAQNDLGRAVLAATAPLRKTGDIRSELAVLEECLEFLSEHNPIGLSQLGDLRSVLTELGIQGSILDVPDFLAILDYLKSAAALKSSFTQQAWPLLSSRFQLPEFVSVAREIERVVDPREGVREGADPELGKIRQRIAGVRSQIQKRLNSYLTGQNARYLIESPFVTQRNSRFVIPLKAEHQKRIPGVAHGSSSSGATIFLEPLPLVDLNNSYLHSQEREVEIIRRILSRLTDFVRTRHHDLERLVACLGDLDALQARALFARRFRCVVPDVTEGEELLLREARHPLLEDALGSGRVVPIDLSLTAERSVIVISGPNTGGKTVALKTTGLLVLLAMAGLPVPAVEARIPCFRTVLVDIGDNQSISESLSTYSGRILRIKEMVETFEVPGLILLDELGGGTDPVYGASLGIAIVDYFRSQSAFVVATTHHQVLKQYAARTPQVLNASVELDLKTMTPTYHLKMGTAAGSSALEIAERLGLPGHLIGQARALLDQRDLQVEQYLNQLREELESIDDARRNLSAELESLGEKRAELEIEYRKKDAQRNQEAEKALEKALEKYRRDADRFLKQLRDRFEAVRVKQQIKQKEALLRDEFRRRLSATRVPEGALRPGKSLPVLREGEWVYNSFFRKRGQVVELGQEQVVLLVEGKKVRSRVEDLEPLPEVGPASTRVPANVVLDVVEEAPPELNLVGSRVEDALDRLDKYLDRAVVSQLSKVRIIHGFGTGRLRRAVVEFLKGHTQVAHVSTEGGATVASLKYD